MSDKQPVYVMPENVSRTLGRDAQRNNIFAAKIIADIVKTTLGPKGMDKMLVDATGEIIVTNDGVTILQEMELDHPAAKMIVEIAKTQEEEVGDGTTTVAMLAGKLLENAEDLLDKKIHPTVIAKGYQLAESFANKTLKELALPVDNHDILRSAAMTAMTGKGAEGHREHLAKLIVSAVDKISSGRELDVHDIKIETQKGMSVAESEMIEGLVLDKERANSDMPMKIEEAKIALLDFPLELKNPEIETKVSISTPQQLQEFITAEEATLKNMTETIIRSGANVVFCQKGIDDIAQYYLARAGILGCRRVAKSDMQKLARATSGKILSTIEELKTEDLGYAQKVEEVQKNEEGMIYVRGCRNPRAVTLLIRGTTEHVASEIERAVKDGLGDVAAAIKDGFVVAGGGAIEIALAKRLRDYSNTLGGREQLAVVEFANALESIPEALAENAGLDPITTLTELKQQHETGATTVGLNLFKGRVEDAFKAGIIEPLKVKTQALQSATEVAAMILRIDDVLIASGGKSGMPTGGGVPPQYAGMD